MHVPRNHVEAAIDVDVTKYACCSACSRIVIRFWSAFILNVDVKEDERSNDAINK